MVWKPEIYNPAKPVTQPHENRRTRQANKEINEFMEELLQEYFMARTKVEDPKGTEIKEKYKILNSKWKHFGYKWNNNPKRVKNAGNVTVRLAAFEDRVKEYTKQVEKAEKKTNPKPTIMDRFNKMKKTFLGK